MTATSVALTALAIIFLARLVAGALALLGRNDEPWRALTWLAGGTADAAAVVVGFLAVLGGAHPDLTIFGGDAFGRAVLAVDPLSGFFLFITGVIGLPLGLFSFAGPWEADAQRTPPAETAAYQLLLGATTLVICAHNVFVFLFAWELTSLAMYLAIANQRQSARVASPAFFTLSLAKVPAAALVAAFLLLATRTGSFDFGVLARSGPLLGSDLRGTVLVLALIGFGAKVGVVPMQVWMPRGYPAAPANVAAVMSGIVLNLGIYGLIRVAFTFLGHPDPWWGLLVMLGGALTAFVGILYGVVQDDFRRFISYSSVEHAGIMLIGVGVALQGKSAHLPLLAGAGLVAACIDLLQHAAAKSLLFADAGGVERVADTTAMARLGGLGRRVPLLAGTALVGVLSLAAMPPLGGFSGEWLTFEALMQGFRLGGLAGQLGTAIAGALLALTAGLALIAFVKLYGIVFLGVPRSAAAADARDVGRLAGTALFVLALVVVAIGVAVPWVAQFAADAMAGAAGANVAANLTVWPHLAIQPAFANFSSASPTELAIVIPVLLLVPLALRKLFAPRDQRMRRVRVWASASNWPEPQIEYTPLAYSNFARVVFQGLYGLRRRLDESGPSPLFPHELRYQSSIVQVFQTWFYRPLIAAALAVTTLVRRSQSGVIGLYLLYMLIVLLGILAVIRVMIGG